MLQYDHPVYRPPSEADSLIIQAVIGCPHNRCGFCDMYQAKKFRARPQAEILDDIERARLLYGPQIPTIFLADGNAIVLPTERLAEICQKAHELFPALRRITVYGSAKFVARKTPEELTLLRAAGLTRLHMGLESGDDVTLKKIEKGADAQTIVRAGRLVMDAEIELSLYVMIGVAGVERTHEHATASAAVINAVRPTFVRLRTFIPRRNTPLLREWREGRLTLPDPYQALRETRELIAGIDASTLLQSDHLSNFLDVSGGLPEQKGALLMQIDEALTWPRDRFRPDSAALIEIGL